jgi:hypothetical protein
MEAIAWMVTVYARTVIMGHIANTPLMVPVLVVVPQAVVQAVVLLVVAVQVVHLAEAAAVVEPVQAP